MSSYMFTTISDHATQAKARQVEFFKGKPNFELLIDILAGRIQALESVVVDFRDKRHIDGAEGVQLDKLGLCFQVDRKSLGDSAYRAAIKAAYIQVAKSGEPETLIEALGVYTNATRIKLMRYRSCTVILNAEVSDPSLLDATGIYAKMQLVKAAGVCLETTVSKDSGAFSFISLGDTPDDSLGFSSLSDPTKGGTFGSKI